jgi:DNA-directed RNA polymerase subunit RPC12/RpoP
MSEYKCLACGYTFESNDDVPCCPCCENEGLILVEDLE